ncbi:hypothetical protein GCM10011450_01280 [Advenella faeciporci]|uniref:Uncharacterized protein n=1 Tax=Advenella faeciporci TaxID=797535 RepID=A0A918MV13_9BURK|nr:hypothetical protein GCM10011450_01280 [Advenella faeciporci]
MPECSKAIVFYNRPTKKQAENLPATLPYAQKQGKTQGTRYLFDSNIRVINDLLVF